MKSTLWALVLIDSTGIKIVGASTWREWQRYVPGGPHDFRKLHIALDAATPEIVAVEVTDKYDCDKDQVAAFLAQIVDPSQRVIPDGNYDFDNSREAIYVYGAQDLSPPRTRSSYSVAQGLKNLSLNLTLAPTNDGAGKAEQ